MQDVADELGVSRTLVSFVFRGAPGVGNETKAKILETAQRLGYRRDVIASQLASKRTNTVGLSLLDLRFEINTDVFEGVRAAAERQGRRVFLAVGDADGTRERETLGSLVDVRVDGVVLTGSLLPDEVLQSYAKRVPLVVATRLVPGVDSVATNDAAGATLAVRHLFGLGHRNIAHIGAPAWYPYTARSDGYLDAMRDAALSPRVVRADFTQAGAEQAAVSLLRSDQAPTAIFCHNDVAALGVRDAARALSVRIPEDVSIVGFDDTHVASLPGIDLTSVTQHAAAIGETAEELLALRLGEPDREIDHRVYEPGLVVRVSTAAPLS